MANFPAIRVKGARQNNLKNLDLEIPLNRITVITGVSGSGKSSLAFDTLYAEGQRRYVETFSPYARQFMDRMDRPRVDKIEGIPPAIAIDRKDPVRTSRSTVGTMTEITDYVKLLFARLAQLHCKQCGRPVQPETPEHVWHYLRDVAAGSEIIITFPCSAGNLPADRLRRELIRQGYDRYYEAGDIKPLDEWQPDGKDTRVDVLADRLKLRTADRKRIIDSAELAFRFGAGGWMFGSIKRSLRLSAAIWPAPVAVSATAHRCRTCSLLTAPSGPARPAGDSGGPSVSIWIWLYRIPNAASTRGPSNPGDHGPTTARSSRICWRFAETKKSPPTFPLGLFRKPGARPSSTVRRNITVSAGFSSGSKPRPTKCRLESISPVIAVTMSAPSATEHGSRKKHGCIAWPITPLPGSTPWMWPRPLNFLTPLRCRKRMKPAE